MIHARTSTIKGCINLTLVAIPSNVLSRFHSVTCKIQVNSKRAKPQKDSRTSLPGIFQPFMTLSITRNKRPIFCFIPSLPAHTKIHPESQPVEKEKTKSSKPPNILEVPHVNLSGCMYTPPENTRNHPVAWIAHFATLQFPVS